MAKKKSARSKGYRNYKPQPKTISPATWKKIGFGALALVIVIVLVVLLYDDGSLKMKGDSVVVSGNNPLVLDVSEKGSSHKYYKVGEVSPIDGFSVSDVSYITDANEFLYYFEPDGEGEDIDQYYVVSCQGVYNEMPDKTRSTIAAYSRECVLGDVTTTKLADKDVCYYSYTYGIDDDTGENIIGYCQTLTAYIPTARENGCFLTSLVKDIDSPEDALDESVLVGYLEQIVAKIDASATK